MSDSAAPSRFKKYRTLRITRELESRIQPLATALDWTLDQFTTHALISIADLAEAPPEARTLPPLVAMLDGARQIQPALLPMTKGRFALNEEGPASKRA